MADEGTGQQYQSLYRRYRPQRFSEVRGQDHVVMALRNAVRDERVAHAYLFSGPRGTGKTSTARILAKALNCLAPEDGEPCGRCASCVAIANTASLDVHELDAASNNGVDAMRDLVGRAALATPGKWKVYIVDEVHMLSTAASNALLKTLEEPPGHVVFVLATTDPQKVLPTIRSRTQHYEFHLFEADVLENLLADIASDAHLELPAGGIEAAVRRGHGSARDAVSALDQVVAAGVVEEDDRFVRDLVRALADRDSAEALRTVASALAFGTDANRLGEQLVDALRTMFLSAVAPGLVRHPAGQEASIGPDGAPALSPARCVRAMELLGAALVDMREALDPRITLEVVLIRLTDPEVDDSPAALLDRVERLERRLHELAGQLVHAAPAAGAPAAPAGPVGSGPPAQGRGPGSAPPPPRPQPQFQAAPPPDPATPPASASTPASPPPPASGPLADLGPPGAAGPAGSEERPAAAGGMEARPALGAFRARQPASSPAASAVATADPPAPAPAPAAPPSVLPAPASGSSGAPSRDDVVQAWGDHVLARLRPRMRAVYAGGRFLSMADDVAVFALPNAAHVEHAEPFRAEMASALSQHFGCRIDVRLETDDDPIEPAGSTADEPEAFPSRGGGTREAPAAAAQHVDPDVPEMEELETGSDAGRHDSLSWAESRLLDAFPGAEEVT